MTIACGWRVEPRTEASPEMFIGQGRQFSTDAGDYAR